MADKELY